MTLYKKELRNKALELQNMLEKQNIKVSFNNNSFRDYLIRLAVAANDIPGGNLLVYYKPTKNTYSLRKQINNSEIDTIIDSVWNKINRSETYPAESGIYEAFVDGSYISGVTGYGAAIYLGNELKAEISGAISDAQFRQFDGELKSVVETIKWCRDNGIKKIRINYDYQGIEKFATGKWKAGNDISKEYVDFILKAKMEIEWRHIKSHTGNQKNNKADFLAKKAALRKK
ncbi:RNase H family protein [Candidatus Endomicrobiellum agilis]|uniref:RNase H family protein n=1 Tax=Candidatus Endomicrobiellum agilis TaxID=3238957 RepID=UPI0035725879|nr:reverse transcriptase-like protein [Endomicrobium sp.]MCA6085619.1 reverse transcriptase-like protein [Endomicrobium sp.]